MRRRDKPAAGDWVRTWRGCFQAEEAAWQNGGESDRAGTPGQPAGPGQPWTGSTTRGRRSSWSTSSNAPGSHARSTIPPDSLVDGWVPPVKGAAPARNDQLLLLPPARSPPRPGDCERSRHKPDLAVVAGWLPSSGAWARHPSVQLAANTLHRSTSGVPQGMKHQGAADPQHRDSNACGLVNH